MTDSVTYLPWARPADVGNGALTVSAAGLLKWSFATGHYVDSSPVIGADGTIYVGSSDWNFYALNPDGSEKWRYSYGAGPGGGSGAGAAIGLDGTLYVTMGVDPRKLYAFRPDGTKIWEFSFGSPVALTYASAPVIGSEGTIYAAANDHKLYALNPDGTKKWESIIGAYTYSTSSPALGRHCRRRRLGRDCRSGRQAPPENLPHGQSPARGRSDRRGRARPRSPA